MQAICHPEKRAKCLSLGLCESCYKKHRRQDPNVVEAIRKGARESYARNRDKRRLTGRAYRLKRRYDITPEDLDRMKKEQDLRCAICRQVKKLNVDHDHATGRVRGLLCHGCNTSVGYLENHTARMWQYIGGTL